MRVRKVTAAAALSAATVVGFIGHGFLGDSAQARRPRTNRYICMSQATTLNRTSIHNPSSKTVSYTRTIYNEDGVVVGAPSTATIAPKASTGFDSGVVVHVTSRSKLLVYHTQGSADAIHDGRCI